MRQNEVYVPSWVKDLEVRRRWRPLVGKWEDVFGKKRLPCCAGQFLRKKGIYGSISPPSTGLLSKFFLDSCGESSKFLPESPSWWFSDQHNRHALVSHLGAACLWPLQPPLLSEDALAKLPSASFFAQGHIPLKPNLNLTPNGNPLSPLIRHMFFFHNTSQCT